jgi:hypothetical protein
MPSITENKQSLSYDDNHMLDLTAPLTLLIPARLPPFALLF